MKYYKIIIHVPVVLKLAYLHVPYPWMLNTYQHQYTISSIEKKNMKIFLLFFFSIKKPHKTILKLAKFKIYVHAVQSHKTCKKVLKRKKNPSLEKEPKLSY